MSEAQVAGKVGEVVSTIMSLSDDEKNGIVLEVFSRSTVGWLAAFSKAYEQKFGVTAAPIAAVAMPGAGAPAAAAAPKEEEKSTFDVILKECGSNKIQVIKVVREATKLGLMEAKALVDGAPKPVRKDVPKDEAEKLLKSLEAAGAKAVLE